MIVTEEEAKTKRCQESFGDHYLTADGNSVISVSMNFGAAVALQASPSYCIGSACMAWRWKRGSLYRPVDPADQLPQTHANFHTFEEIEEKGDYSTTHGYCGKAGKP
jgi:hypothetical protein